MSNRPFNFAAGPSTIPDAILEKAKSELLSWNGSGVSPMEVGHRTPEFTALINNLQDSIKKMLNVPDNYKVLFMHGGAQGQFAFAPMNLLGSKTSADYINTGTWSNKAVKEAGLYCDVNVAATLTEGDLLSVPAQNAWNLSDDAAFVYYCSNETINGVEFNWTPQTGDVPLVCDMTSSIASRPIDVASHGVIFAGAQKNLGIAGLAIVIVRDDLLDSAITNTPRIFRYKDQAAQSSLLNTPPTYACYMTSLFCEWVEEQGGVEALEKINIEKAKLLYDAIDSSDFYRNPIDPAYRSRMNVTFNLPNEDMEKHFFEDAKNRGLISLKGHRSVGGVRASIYNAMPLEGVKALADFMREFEKERG